MKVIAAACGSLLVVAFLSSGFRVNLTPSIPLGIYWKSSAELVRGSYVAWCPPATPEFVDARERGYVGHGLCPGGFGVLLKKVAALPGDRVRISDEGITVNGRLLPGTRPIPEDAEGQTLLPARLERFLEASELVLVGDGSPLSFDSRYFGAARSSQVVEVVEPAWSW